MRKIVGLETPKISNSTIYCIAFFINGNIPMADLIITYWRDIPAQVTVKKGRKAARRQLPERFEQAIDMCAMRVGAKDTDAYLAEWRKGEPINVGDDLEAEVDEALEKIITEFDQVRLKTLISNEGFDK